MRYLALLGILVLSLSFSQDSGSTNEGNQDDTPVTSELPSEETPSEETPSEETPSEETPSEEPPSDETAQEEKKPLSGITIKRKDRTIKVLQYAPADKGAISRLNIPECEDDLKLNVFYAPDPYPYVETLVNETVITSRIAIHRQPPKEKGGGDKAQLELFGGSLTMDEETRCPDKVERSSEADVTLTQGRTTILGKTFNYDNDKGLGNMDGPVSLDRIAEGDSPALKANSDKLEFNVDTDQKILTGNVTIESEDRVSEADRLEYDEENSIAVLYGNPAKSTKGEDTMEGNVIIYYLDKNDILIKGNIQGTVQINLGGADSGSDTSAEPPGEPSVDEEQ
jgi:lipopolysaccharide export system protein LptA